MAEDLEVAVARIEEKLDGQAHWLRDHIDYVKSALKETKEVYKGLELRVSDLEGWRWKVTGVAVAAGSLTAVVTGIVLLAIQKLIGG